jgi:hypothetical protein
MANGTIAFDTLTTSDSAKSNTEKSINTSYIFNGVSKSWVGILNKSAVSNGDSLNVSSLTDPGTGRIQITYSNNMNNATYSVTLGEGGNYAYQGKVTSTSQAEHGSVNNSGSYTDSTNGSLTIHGDLA